MPKHTANVDRRTGSDGEKDYCSSMASTGQLLAQVPH